MAQALIFFAMLLSIFPARPVILMTAYGDVADAVSLVKAGAVDYLTKPFDIVEFIDKLRRQLSHVADARLFTDAPGISSTTFKPGSGFLGKSLSMRKIERLMARLYESDSSVLITGESGVGKEVIASMIHNNSSRRSGPMVRVNCAALSPGLVESELFGHEKGSFTGALKRRTGRFEQAQGGTIFLDEIAEVSQDIQVKLLRVLQERVIERVGGQEPIPLDVRVVVATQVDLEDAIERGEFRPDLYWRINVIRIDVPPLRERIGGCPLPRQEVRKGVGCKGGKPCNRHDQRSRVAAVVYGVPRECSRVEKYHRASGGSQYRTAHRRG